MAALSPRPSATAKGLGRGALLLSALAFAMATPATPARADGGDFIAGAIIGGILGGAAANSNKQKKRTSTRSSKAPKSSGISSAQRESNRDVQTALNTFGFPVGTPDGSLGPKSRAAISQYQVFMGYPPTGQLTELERMILVGAMQKSIIGGVAVASVVASHPQGMRGLLLNERDMMAAGGGTTQMVGGGVLAGLPPEVSAVVFEIAQNAGIQPQQLAQKAGFVQLADMNADGRTDYLLDTSATGSAFWCNAQSCAVRVFVSTPEGYRRNDFQAFNATPAMFSCIGASCMKSETPSTVVAVQPEPVVPQPAPQPDAGVMVSAPVEDQAEPALPVFTIAAPAAPTQSAAAHCANVAMVTSSAGGFVTEASLTDPMQALGEQFCLARGYAINDGQDLAAKVVGATPAQIEAQCLGLVPALAAQVGALGQSPAADVVTATQGFITGSGQTPAQLSDMARICLSVAYRTDNAELALGSALLLTGAGNAPYGELVGEHLAMGFGLPADKTRAADWLQMGLAAQKAGAPAVFAPAQPERAALLEKVVAVMTGAAPVPAAQPVSALPSFTLTPQPAPAAPAQP